ncbi:MAG TPA: L-seryl-tRNA(Sec) selenium transferase [Anaerolineales bacterium]|nr:L-seryl-tRNA(Sec) selenium transferase [Anaerolineales bacterium]
MTDSEDFQKIPSVDALLKEKGMPSLIVKYGRPFTVEAIRAVLSKIRERVKVEQGTIPLPEIILQDIQQYLQEWSRPTLVPVINAAGVILHTNLGRAPLSDDTLNAIQRVAQGYSTLEYDLDKGARGSRYVHAEKLLTRITGAEAAMVVNNNASALLLILYALARRRRTLVSRTQLIEIGGGFRIPDVMVQSGAVLEEIGTTNKVNIDDYRQAIEEHPIKLVLRAHRSNFQLVGFTEEPTLEEIVEVAHAADVPVIDDLGSGSFLDTAQYGLKHEMTVQESLAAGSDLVCFSGDKLLGGPQAGIIVGRKDLIQKIRKHPIARAVRADKLALSGLTATLLHYLKDEAETKVPIWQMIAMPMQEIEARARKWLRVLKQGEILDGESTVGGGSLPGETLPTKLIALSVDRPDAFCARLRRSHPPIIARVENDKVLFDPRTVLEKQEGALLVEVQNALTSWRR